MSSHEGEDAATAAATSPNDVTIAATLQAIEQLTSVFGFDWEVAQRAVETVGVDVTTAYNYILDEGLGQDQGGPIVPIEDCPHVADHVVVAPPELPSPHSNCSYREAPPSGHAKGETCEDGTCPGGENWVCLQCGVVRCSRYVNGHCVSHWEETKQQGDVGHCIAASFADLSVWCYQCSAYLRHPDLDPLVKRLEELKFETPISQQEEPPDDHDEEQQRHVDDESTDYDDVGRGFPFSVSEYERERPAYPFGTLPKTLKEVADFILSDKCQSIVVLAGAGMSVTSGIPDFRSAGGFYDTLRPELLTATAEEREIIRNDPTAALTQTLFLQNQLPCLELKRPFLLGTRNQEWKATLTHRFVELLHSKTGKLTRLYQQNIDGLEGQCHQLPQSKVIPVHGSMNRAECAMCGQSANFDNFCNNVERQIKDITGRDPKAPSESTEICCEVCGYAAVKPSIVLFRASLPEEFFQAVPNDLPGVDLLIVVGTSLTVAPANTIVFRVPSTAMRLVVNRDRVGRRLGIQYDEESERDYFAPGDCDTVLLDLMIEMGWLDDLAPLVNDLPAESSRLLRERLETNKEQETSEPIE